MKRFEPAKFPPALFVNLADDPIWEIGDVRLLAIFREGSKETSPRKYRVVGRERIEDRVRYELSEIIGTKV